MHGQHASEYSGSCGVRRWSGWWGMVFTEAVEAGQISSQCAYNINY